MSATHRRYARSLAASAMFFASGSVAVAAWSTATFGLGDGGYLLPAVAFLYGATVLAWASARERAAGRHAVEEAAWARANLGEIPPPLVPSAPVRAEQP